MNLFLFAQEHIQTCSGRKYQVYLQEMGQPTLCRADPPLAEGKRRDLGKPGFCLQGIRAESAGGSHSRYVAKDDIKK